MMLFMLMPICHDYADDMPPRPAAPDMALPHAYYGHGTQLADAAATPLPRCAMLYAMAIDANMLRPR